MSGKVLVTGGAGFIGSHTCVELIAAGYTPVVLDNLSNSHAAALEAVERVAGYRPELFRGDVRDERVVLDVLDRAQPDAVIHFAGCKAVAESVREPLKYYANNVAGTSAVLAAMAKSGLRRIVFSSSCTVYGNAERCPVDEHSPIAPVTPYGHSKAMCEQMLTDVVTADGSWGIVALRYFNPTGAHESGMLGEDPLGVPSNVMPYITQVAVGRLDKLVVYGSDYPTRDGTAVRDYIHVMDIAAGHAAALGLTRDRKGLLAINLGRGAGYSVLELVAAFERHAGLRIPYEIAPRRPGDMAEVFANPALAERELGWRARRDLDRMCEDAWRWQTMNPRGYAS